MPRGSEHVPIVISRLAVREVLLYNTPDREDEQQQLLQTIRSIINEGGMAMYDVMLEIIKRKTGIELKYGQTIDHIIRLDFQNQTNREFFPTIRIMLKSLNLASLLVQFSKTDKLSGLHIDYVIGDTVKQASCRRLFNIHNVLHHQLAITSASVVWINVSKEGPKNFEDMEPALKIGDTYLVPDLTRAQYLFCYREHAGGVIKKDIPQWNISVV